jgi:hypothetical protein
MKTRSRLQKILTTTALISVLATPAIAQPNKIDNDFFQLTQKGKEVCHDFLPVPQKYDTLYWTKDVYYDRKLNLIHIRDGNYGLYTSQRMEQTEVLSMWENVVQQYAVKRQEEVERHVRIPKTPAYTTPSSRNNICCPKNEEKIIVVPVTIKEAQKKEDEQIRNLTYIDTQINADSIGQMTVVGTNEAGGTIVINPPRPISAPAPEKKGYTAKGLAGAYYDEDFNIQPDLGFVVFATPKVGAGVTAAFGNNDDFSQVSIRGRLEYVVNNADLHVEGGVRSMKNDATSASDGIFGVGAGIHSRDLGIEGTVYLIDNEPGIGVRLTKLFSP